MRTTYLILFGLLLMQSCTDSSSSSSIPANPDGMQANLTERATVNPKAVAVYKQKLDNKLNDYYFSVELFETKKPLDYVVQMGYEAMQNADTIHFPNLGYPIKPAIQKSTDSLAIYIGFIDAKGQFQYFKGVWADKNGLNIRTVRKYGDGKDSSQQQ